jgi:hypothetical protein
VQVGWKLASPGRTITSTPRKPSTTLPARLLVMRSPRISAASSATQAWRREFEREHRGKRQQRDRERPAELADKCVVLRAR